MPPGHVLGEGRSDVEDAPGVEHAVVDGGEEGDQEHGPANTCQGRPGFSDKDGLRSPPPPANIPLGNTPL